VRAKQETPVWLLYARDGRKYLISDNIEADRIMKEEGLTELKFERRTSPWFYASPGYVDDRLRAMRDIAGTALVGSDGLAGTEDISGDLARSRFPLTAVETGKCRWLGARAGEAVAAVCRAIRPGQTETEIAGMLAGNLGEKHIRPTVILIGCDERVNEFRRLTPTDKVLKKYAMVNLCAERWGLVVAVGRLVHFGRPSAELRARIAACAAVDAAYLAAARPGTAFGRVFAAGVTAYTRAGWPEEWRRSSQGGPTGYNEREWLMTPDCKDQVAEGMTVAFNPSLPGVIIEDTVLVGKHTIEILTATADWPMIAAKAGGEVYYRPDILVRNGP
jgi:antitoxin VapB